MVTPPRIDAPIGPRIEVESVDRLIRAFADIQHGVVARQQLLSAGVSAKAIRVRLESGHLAVVHRGVYSVGHGRLTRRGRWMAAVLACGPGAVLSHRDAADLHGIRPCNRRKIDIAVGRWRKGPDVVDIHTSKIEDDERTEIDGIPVTTAFRTLLDLTRCLNDRELQRALDETERLGIAETPSLASLLQRHERRPGTRRLANLQPDPAITRSELERRFVEMVEREGLPRPETNVLVEGYEVDCVWREQRVVVELDGYAFHRTRRSFERDRARDLALTAAGYRPVLITWRGMEEAAGPLHTLLTPRSTPSARSAPAPSRRSPPAP